MIIKAELINDNVQLQCTMSAHGCYYVQIMSKVSRIVVCHHFQTNNFCNI